MISSLKLFTFFSCYLTKGSLRKMIYNYFLCVSCHFEIERQTTVKRPWTTEECAAVEKHLKKYIVLNQVPGKLDCELCISAEPESLKNRDWKAVKYYVKNRITSVKRKCR